MFKRLFPTLSEWPAEKWLALPGVLLIAVAVLTVTLNELIRGID